MFAHCYENINAKKNLKDLSTVAERINWNFTIGNCAALTLCHDTPSKLKKSASLPAKTNKNKYVVGSYVSNMKCMKGNSSLTKFSNFTNRTKNFGYWLNLNRRCVCVVECVRPRKEQQWQYRGIYWQSKCAFHAKHWTMLMQDACSSLSKFFCLIAKLFLCISRALFIDLVENAILSVRCLKLGRCQWLLFSDFHFHCGIWFFEVLFGPLEIWLNQNWIIDSIEWTDWCCFHWNRGHLNMKLIFCHEIKFNFNWLKKAQNWLILLKI